MADAASGQGAIDGRGDPMTWHSPMPFATRWRNVKEKRRGSVRFWIVDAVYLFTGFCI